MEWDLLFVILIFLCYGFYVLVCMVGCVECFVCSWSLFMLVVKIIEINVFFKISVEDVVCSGLKKVFEMVKGI